MIVEETRSSKVRKSVKRFLSDYPLVYGIALKIYLYFHKPELTIQERILKALGSKSRIFFLQVGSNDGLQGDPLHELIAHDKKWTGVFIEPVGFLFQRLTKNYIDNGRFIFENLAIDLQRCTRTFFYVSPKAKEELGDELPYWHDQLGSFNRDHILKPLAGKLEPYIVEEQIKCVPLQDVLDRNNVTEIDLIHIDTEGYDYKILSQVDLSRYKPSIILFEHQLLSPDELQKARLKLQHAEYELFEYGADTLAVRRSTV